MQACKKDRSSPKMEVSPLDFSRVKVEIKAAHVKLMVTGTGYATKLKGYWRHQAQ